MGGNRAVRRYELELWLAPLIRRVQELEDWKREHEREHDQDDDDEQTQARERRRWTLGTVIATLGAAATVAAAAAAVLGR